MRRKKCRGALILVLFSLAHGPLAAAPIRTVVLDPGHGGDQPGARSGDGVAEKEVVLAIARHARAVLEKKGVRVLSTRGSDETLSLDRRTAIANREAAAAYVSIHANFAPVPERRGAETYILSAHASDDAALALLHLEEDEGSGGTRFANEEEFGGGLSDREKGDVDLILADLARAAAHEESALLARRIQDSLGQVAGLSPSRGLRQAPFRVLKHAKVPAALVEVGYLSHQGQARFLATDAGQRAAGEAIARGVQRFLADVGSASVPRP